MTQPSSAQRQAELAFATSTGDQVTSLDQLAPGISLQISHAAGADLMVRVLEITAHRVGGHAEVSPADGGGDPFLVWDFDLDPVAQSFAHTRKFIRA
jgi:hypothetical protein